MAMTKIFDDRFVGLFEYKELKSALGEFLQKFIYGLYDQVEFLLGHGMAIVLAITSFIFVLLVPWNISGRMGVDVQSKSIFTLQAVAILSLIQDVKVTAEPSLVLSSLMWPLRLSLLTVRSFNREQHSKAIIEYLVIVILTVIYISLIFSFSLLRPHYSFAHGRLQVKRDVHRGDLFRPLPLTNEGSPNLKLNIDGEDFPIPRPVGPITYDGTPRVLSDAFVPSKDPRQSSFGIYQLMKRDFAQNTWFDKDPIPASLFAVRCLILPSVVVLVRFAQFKEPTGLLVLIHHLALSIIIIFYVIIFVVYTFVARGLVFSEMLRTWHDRWAFGVNGRCRELNTSFCSRVLRGASVNKHANGVAVDVTPISNQSFATSQPTPYYFRPVSSPLISLIESLIHIRKTPESNAYRFGHYFDHYLDEGKDQLDKMIECAKRLEMNLPRTVWENESIVTQQFFLSKRNLSQGLVPSRVAAMKVLVSISPAQFNALGSAWRNTVLADNKYVVGSFYRWLHLGNGSHLYGIHLDFSVSQLPALMAVHEEEVSIWANAQDLNFPIYRSFQPILPNRLSLLSPPSYVSSLFYSMINYTWLAGSDKVQRDREKNLVQIDYVDHSLELARKGGITVIEQPVCTIEEEARLQPAMVTHDPLMDKIHKEDESPATGVDLCLSNFLYLISPYLLHQLSLSRTTISTSLFYPWVSMISIGYVVLDDLAASLWATLKDSEERQASVNIEPNASRSQIGCYIPNYNRVQERINFELNKSSETHKGIHRFALRFFITLYQFSIGDAVIALMIVSLSQSTSTHWLAITLKAIFFLYCLYGPLSLHIYTNESNAIMNTFARRKLNRKMKSILSFFRNRRLMPPHALASHALPAYMRMDHSHPGNLASTSATKRPCPILGGQVITDWTSDKFSSFTAYKRYHAVMEDLKAKGVVPTEAVEPNHTRPKLVRHGSMTVAKGGGAAFYSRRSGKSHTLAVEKKSAQAKSSDNAFSLEANELSDFLLTHSDGVQSFDMTQQESVKAAIPVTHSPASEAAILQHFVTIGVRMNAHYSTMLFTACHALEILRCDVNEFGWYLSSNLSTLDRPGISSLLSGGDNICKLLLIPANPAVLFPLGLGLYCPILPKCYFDAWKSKMADEAAQGPQSLGLTAFDPQSSFVKQQSSITGLTLGASNSLKPSTGVHPTRCGHWGQSIGACRIEAARDAKSMKSGPYNFKKMFQRNSQVGVHHYSRSLRLHLAKSLIELPMVLDVTTMFSHSADQTDSCEIPFLTIEVSSQTCAHALTSQRIRNTSFERSMIGTSPIGRKIRSPINQILCDWSQESMERSFQHLTSRLFTLHLPAAFCPSRKLPKKFVTKMNKSGDQSALSSVRSLRGSAHYELANHVVLVRCPIGSLPPDRQDLSVSVTIREDLCELVPRPHRKTHTSADRLESKVSESSSRRFGLSNSFFDGMNEEGGGMERKRPDPKKRRVRCSNPGVVTLCFGRDQCLPDPLSPIECRPRSWLVVHKDSGGYTNIPTVFYLYPGSLRDGSLEVVAHANGGVQKTVILRHRHFVPAYGSNIEEGVYDVRFYPSETKACPYELSTMSASTSPCGGRLIIRLPQNIKDTRLNTYLPFEKYSYPDTVINSEPFSSKLRIHPENQSTFMENETEVESLARLVQSWIKSDKTKSTVNSSATLETLVCLRDFNLKESSNRAREPANLPFAPCLEKWGHVAVLDPQGPQDLLFTHNVVIMNDCLLTVVSKGSDRDDENSQIASKNASKKKTLKSHTEYLQPIDYQYNRARFNALSGALPISFQVVPAQLKPCGENEREHVVGFGELRGALGCLRSYQQVLYAYWDLLTFPHYNGDIVRGMAREFLGADVYSKRWRSSGFNLNVRGQVVDEDFRDCINLTKRKDEVAKAFIDCTASVRVEALQGLARVIDDIQLLLRLMTVLHLSSNASLATRGQQIAELQSQVHGILSSSNGSKLRSKLSTLRSSINECLSLRLGDKWHKELLNRSSSRFGADSVDFLMRSAALPICQIYADNAIEVSPNMARTLTQRWSIQAEEWAVNQLGFSDLRMLLAFYEAHSLLEARGILSEARSHLHFWADDEDISGNHRHELLRIATWWHRYGVDHPLVTLSLGSLGLRGHSSPPELLMPYLTTSSSTGLKHLQLTESTIHERCRVDLMKFEQPASPTRYLSEFIPCHDPRGQWRVSCDLCPPPWLPPSLPPMSVLVRAWPSVGKRTAHTLFDTISGKSIKDMDVLWCSCFLSLTSKSLVITQPSKRKDHTTRRYIPLSLIHTMKVERAKSMDFAPRPETDLYQLLQLDKGLDRRCFDAQDWSLDWKLVVRLKETVRTDYFVALPSSTAEMVKVAKQSGALCQDSLLDTDFPFHHPTKKDTVIATLSHGHFITLEKADELKVFWRVLGVDQAEVDVANQWNSEDRSLLTSSSNAPRVSILPLSFRISPQCADIWERIIQVCGLGVPAPPPGTVLPAYPSGSIIKSNSEVTGGLWQDPLCSGSGANALSMMVLKAQMTVLDEGLDDPRLSPSNHTTMNIDSATRGIVQSNKDPIFVIPGTPPPLEQSDEQEADPPAEVTQRYNAKDYVEAKMEPWADTSELFPFETTMEDLESVTSIVNSKYLPGKSPLYPLGLKEEFKAAQHIGDSSQGGGQGRPKMKKISKQQEEAMRLSKAFQIRRNMLS
eukprot:GHVH01010494.1.p1 GENE.GHVH01010494.1~~GHVH01010494.1.p1  ORF type:complete len:2674 (-),score=313.61 GHVH01010494.1:88-8109(-)